MTDSKTLPELTEPFSAAMLRGMRTTVPMLVGTVPLGFILGTQGGQHGLSGLGMALMTGMNFAGGSEFAAVALWSAAPSFLVIFMTTWLINCRHIVLGAALTPWLERARTPVPAAMLAFFLMCDETWALSMQEVSRRRKLGLPADKVFSLPFHIGVGLTLWSTWWIAAGTGAVVGSAMGDLARWGFLMAFPATFIGLVVAMRPALGKSLPMAVSGVSAALASLWLPLHWSILIAAVLGLAAAAFVPAKD
ncbi:AzlC family ABC transporter permease [Sutterella sp.]|uniref:AzlC family ABC transporter permease n=1 Tax=Sutterella sp. TaxID=1981025 RepID=UPI0026DF785C|nr:AzlC family ABC transporter permease [Sutterella sp.]MDO5532174.1 AzlC family ABC transporter permease [Sutterella sp.]